MATAQTSEVQLKREMGLFSASCFIVSTMVGSGIFITPGTALEYIGSVAMALIVWATCGFICLMAALAYAELGTVVNRSGSEYAYYMESFGHLNKSWGPLPAFLYSFILVLVLRPVQVAIIVMISGTYIVNFINEFVCIGNDVVVKWATVAISVTEMCVITIINATSVKLFVRVQNVFTFLKILVCLVVIGGGIYELIKGKTENIEKGFEGTTVTPKGIALAFYSGLWAYEGWNSITFVTEEIKRPEVNILRSILCSIPIITAMYVFMNVSYMTILTAEEIVNSTAVAIDFGDRVFGYFSAVIPFGVSVSSFGCAMSLQFSVSRICYVAGQEGHLLPVLSFVHIHRLTPCLGVLLQGLLSICVLFAGDVSVLIQFASFFQWLVYGLAMVSLLVLRKTAKDAPRPFKAPFPIVIFLILVSIFLFAVPLITDPSYKYFIAVALVLVGFILYYVFVYRHIRWRCIDSLTRFLQMLFKVVPTTHTDISQATGSSGGEVLRNENAAETS